MPRTTRSSKSVKPSSRDFGCAARCFAVLYNRLGFMTSPCSDPSDPTSRTWCEQAQYSNRVQKESKRELIGDLSDQRPVEPNKPQARRQKRAKGQRLFEPNGAASGLAHSNKEKRANARAEHS